MQVAQDIPLLRGPSELKPLGLSFTSFSCPKTLNTCHQAVFSS